MIGGYNMTNSDYILFLDESAETKTNPYLLLGGIIISRNNYKKFLNNISYLFISYCKYNSNIYL